MNIDKAKKNFKQYGIANLEQEFWVDSWSGKTQPLKQMVNDYEKLIGSHSKNIDLNSLQKINPLIQIKGIKR